MLYGNRPNDCPVMSCVSRSNVYPNPNLTAITASPVDDVRHGTMSQIGIRVGKGVEIGFTYGKLIL